MKKPIKIAVSLVLLNTMMILPSFFLPRQRPPALDALAGAASVTEKMWAFLLLLRDQNYIWLSAELLAVVTIILLVKKVKTAVFLPLFSIGVILLISYETYEFIIIRFFARQPMWINDRLLFADGFNLLLDLWSHHWMIIIPSVTAVLFVFFLAIPKLVSLLLNARRIVPNKSAYAGVIMSMIGLWLAIYFLYGHDQRFKDREGLVQSTVARILYNRQLSNQYRKNIERILSQPVDSTYYHYDKIRLGEKPDVYLFFVESYGKIVYDDPAFGPVFSELAESFRQIVEQSGHRVVSNFSRSPITGGGSWMSIATTIGGIHIDNQAVFGRYTSKPRPNMAGFFRNQGYWTFLLQPNTKSKPARPIVNQYGFDRMLYYKEMNYKGRHYGYGLVPDQYSLNYSFERFIAPHQGPAFLFFMTVTPHAPWSEVAPVSAHWQDFNDKNEQATEEFNRIRKRIADAGIERLAHQNYLLAIAHDMIIIRDFISRFSGNALFVIIGDHQPPMSNNASGVFETPVHLISDDEELLRCFDKFGFVKGMAPRTAPNSAIRHEALFSILVHALTKCYGQGAQYATVLPHGAKLSLLNLSE